MARLQLAFTSRTSFAASSVYSCLLARSLASWPTTAYVRELCSQNLCSASLADNIRASTASHQRQQHLSFVSQPPPPSARCSNMRDSDDDGMASSACKSESNRNHVSPRFFRRNSSPFSLALLRCVRPLAPLLCSARLGSRNSTPLAPRVGTTKLASLSAAVAVVVFVAPARWPPAGRRTDRRMVCARQMICKRPSESATAAALNSNYNSNYNCACCLFKTTTFWSDSTTSASC